MGKEIETNTKIDNKEPIIQHLQQSAELIFSGKIDITYYHSGLIPDSYARIELYEDGHVFLTAKKALAEGKDVEDINEREEVIIQVGENSEKLLELLHLFGFIETGKKSKKRQLFSLGETQVSIDEWDDKELGIRLEVEGTDEIIVSQVSKQLLNLI